MKCLTLFVVVVVGVYTFIISSLEKIQKVSFRGSTKTYFKLNLESE